MVSAPARSRSVGPFALLALGVNGIVGVGVFFAPSELARLAPGGASTLVMLVTGLALTPVAFAVSTLGRRFDEDGGPVLYARDAFGALAGYFVGWLTYVSAIFSAAAAVTGLTSAVLPDLVDRPWALRGAAIGLATVLALVCAAGIALSARLWTALTILKLLPLLGLLAIAAAAALFAWPLGGGAPVAPVAVPPAHASADWLRAGLTATFVYQGFEIVPVIAGETRSPERSIPIATIGSLVIATLLYVAIERTVVVTLPSPAESHEPLTDAARALAGARWGSVLHAGASISALGIAFGMLVTTPRYLAALAPASALARPSKRSVPLYALAVTWALVSLTAALGTLADLFTLSSLAVLLQYGVVASSLAWLAIHRRRGLAPKDAWSAAPALALSLVLVSAASLREWITAAAFIAIGAAIRRFV